VKTLTKAKSSGDSKLAALIIRTLNVHRLIKTPTKLNKLLTLLLLFCLAAPTLAQVPGTPTQQQEVQLSQLLAGRNIDETELRQRLAAVGIYVDNLSQEEALRLQPQIEAVIDEMEREQVIQEEVAKSSEEIKEAVKDGASVEEAISEVTTEAATEGLSVSKIYGHQVFRNKSLKVYRATEGTTPPESYPLKAGDEIAVTIFGASQTDFILRVDESGFVQLPNTTRIPLAGIPLGEARRVLANRLKRSYTFSNGQLNVRIQAASTINVNIFGEVENNGSFAMSSLNTGFNALVAAGGPTERGTVRNIQLIQGDKKINLDVYEYLQSPTSGSALFLNNNATLYVPLAETIVTLEGGVQRPLQYELKAGETITDLIAFAGGLKARAEVKNIRVTRYVDGQLELFNVDLDQQGGFVLEDEDLVEIPIVENPVENFVTIEGAVLLPGRYAFSEGIDLASLLALGRIRPGARKDVAFLFRSNDDGTSRLIRVDPGENAGAENVKLQRGDVLRILTESSFTDQSNFSVTGAVRDSAVTLPFPQDGALTLEEAVLLAGGLQPNAASEIMLIRTSTSNQEELSYKRLDLRTDGETSLQPLDQVLVYDQERFTDRRDVKISGAVRRSGTFAYGPSLTINELLYLAGGLRIDADKRRVEVFRLQFIDGAETKTLMQTLDLNAVGDFVLQPFDEVVVRSTAEFEKIQNVYVVGEVRYPGNYALLRNNERLNEIIQRAGGLTEGAFAKGATLYRPGKGQGTGYVVLSLDRVLADPTDPSNLVLLRNDTLYVPKKQELVTIYTQNTLADQFGRDSLNVDNARQVAFQGEKSAGWYISNYAGGFDDDSARKRWTTVEYANGQVKETTNFLGIRNYPKVKPGASIWVPSAPAKKRKERREERFDWLGLTSIIVGAATTITTFILLRR
jgi:protein involved in polysaccharide export with SLBB domain